MERSGRGATWDREEPHLREQLDVLIRRRRVVFICVTVIVLTAFVKSLSETPTYRATTTLQIERDTPNVLNFDDLFQVNASSDAFYQTQYQLIQSRKLAQRVIDRVGLADNPEFAGVGESGTTSRVIRWVTTLPSRAVSGLRDAVGTTPANDGNESQPDAESTLLMDDFISRLEVEPIRNTQLARVTWTSASPALAADVTNAVAQAYIDMNLEAKFETTEQASQFLAVEIDRLRGDIAKGEAELQRYGAERDILSSSDQRQDTVTQALADLSAEYTRAQTDRVQKEAYFEQLRQSDPSSPAEVFTNALVTRLKSDLGDAQQQRIELSRRFTEDWPEMQQLRTQIDSLEQRIAETERQIFDGLVRGADSEYQAALDRESRVETLLEQQRAEAIRLNQNLVSYRNLQIEVDNNKELLDSLLERRSETGVSARLQGARTSNIRIIDAATIPLSHYRPNVRWNLLVAAVAGATLGIGLAFFQDYMDNTLKTAEDVEARVGLPNLGLIPSLSDLRNGNGSGLAAYAYGGQDDLSLVGLDIAPETVTHEHPRSLLAEAYRGLRTSVLLGSSDHPPKVLLVTSAVAGEGKTTAALNLAISMVQIGKKVLLIDADLRRPRLHRLLDLSQDKGIVHYLTGSASSLKEVIQKTSLENLWALPSGPKPPNPAELLASERMGGMLDSLRGAFDVVLFDSPPILPVVDALVLVPSMDGVILVVKGAATPSSLVEQSRRRIEDVQGKIIGVALNSVPITSMYYSYGGGYGTERTDDR